jgi:hypothetical protein
MTMRRSGSSLTRRDFFKRLAGGLALPYFTSLARSQNAALSSVTMNDIFWVRNIPDLPFTDPEHENRHLGLDSLLYLMADAGLKFFRSSAPHSLAGPSGLISADDVVLVKVNAQWKYRGATNSDLIRGLIQRILDHPDGFTGEVVIVENGQGRGSLNCDTSSSYGGDTSVRANANDERHSFLYLVNSIFKDPRVSAFLLDPIRDKFISSSDHVTNGYRSHENVSYPCFITAGGRRVELREGIWQGGNYRKNLKLINVPVLKHHDTGGSEITASLKHVYGLVSMSDGQIVFRHYDGLGETCGKMMASVCTPVLNIVDAIWVSHTALTGYPASTTFRANQILASQDPVALDYWAAKHILYPIDGNFRHHPDFSGVSYWVSRARDTINSRGGLRNIDKGILVDQVTDREAEMNVLASDAGDYIRNTRLTLSSAFLSFVAPGATEVTLEKPLHIAVSGGVFSWRVEEDADWLICSPDSGVGETQAAVRVKTPGLEPGRYTGHLFVHSDEAANSPQTVEVLLTVMEPRKRDIREFRSRK